MSAKLVLVATPIGNLEDISVRALKALENCDFIAAEDTRVTLKLLKHFDINKPLVSYHEHNMAFRGEQILNRIINGENCVLVTDAGMPAISDPGEEMVKLCHKNGISVSVIPGACAAVCALAVSGLDTSRFVFEGFLSVTKNKRIERLNELKTEKRTMIFYEAPHKLCRTLNDLYSFFGDRNITLVRELTKIYEEIIPTTLKEAVNIYSEENKPKGEFVLILQGNSESDKEEYTMEDAFNIVSDLMDKGSSLSTACKEAANLTGLKKREIYNGFINK
ncbi:MAG: 16S rRNA (cytidine(1402)-2'-O)-methyltransferase [Clostridia bacterium]|nr:16S rRNA (cytidine(1402)-2'-O)-methyltransferase [Clostridia bacterium]